MERNFKRCSWCHKRKTLDNFYLRKEGRRISHCYVCAAEIAAIRFAIIKANPKKYAAFKAHKRKQHKRWRDNGGIENVRKGTRTYSARVKTEVLSHYGKGGKLACCWRGCKVIDIDVLTLDHIENNGKQHKERGYKGGIGGYVQLRIAGYPDGFQTLCANHQLKKEIIRNRDSRL